MPIRLLIKPKLKHMPFFRHLVSHRFSPTYFKRFLTSIFLLCATASINAAQVPSQISVSADYLFFKHANYNNLGYTLNTEKGWIPGTQLIYSNVSKRLTSQFSLALYNGNIDYTNESTGSNSTANETLIRAAYRFDYALPDKKYHFYGSAMFNNWNREVATINLINQYQWLTFEGGLRFNVISSRNERNNLKGDLGLSRLFAARTQTDLTNRNLGKPIFSPQNKFGISISLIFEHLFNRTQGVNIYAQSTYWQFGTSPNRTIKNNAETVTMNIPDSQSLTTALGMAYFHRF